MMMMVVRDRGVGPTGETHSMIAIGLKNDSIYNQKQNSQLIQENLIHGQCTVA